MVSNKYKLGAEIVVCLPLQKGRGSLFDTSMSLTLMAFVDLRSSYKAVYRPRELRARRIPDSGSLLES